jgi:hypothetical protein
VTSDTQPPGDDASRSDELRRLAEEPAPGLVAEFLHFLRTEKKWWLAPIVLVLLALVALAWFAGTPLGPLLYPGL